jgi:hypothetical protein
MAHSRRRYPYHSENEFAWWIFIWAHGPSGESILQAYLLESITRDKSIAIFGAALLLWEIFCQGGFSVLYPQNPGEADNISCAEPELHEIWPNVITSSISTKTYGVERTFYFWRLKYYRIASSLISSLNPQRDMSSQQICLSLPSCIPADNLVRRSPEEP